MDGSHNQLSSGRRRLNSYTTYSIGFFVAWAVVWVIVLLIDPTATQSHVLFVFLGWLVGWTSATIARFVYPPPRRWRQAGPAAGSEG